MPALCVLITRRQRDTKACTITCACLHTWAYHLARTMEVRCSMPQARAESLTRIRGLRHFVEVGHLLFEVGTHTASPSRSRECCCSHLCTHTRQAIANETSCFQQLSGCAMQRQGVEKVVRRGECSTAAETHARKFDASMPQEKPSAGG